MSRGEYVLYIMRESWYIDPSFDHLVQSLLYLQREPVANAYMSVSVSSFSIFSEDDHLRCIWST